MSWKATCMAQCYMLFVIGDLRTQIHRYCNFAVTHFWWVKCFYQGIPTDEDSVQPYCSHVMIMWILWATPIRLHRYRCLLFLCISNQKCRWFAGLSSCRIHFQGPWHTWHFAMLWCWKRNLHDVELPPHSQHCSLNSYGVCLLQEELPPMYTDFLGELFQ